MSMERYKMLLVEDNPMDQIAFAHAIRNNGLPYDYQIVPSVTEALRIMDDMQFDIVISDFNLGDGTALDVINGAKELPVVITTGSGDEEIAVNAMKHGACDYLIKDDKHNYLKMLPVIVEHAISYKKTVLLTKMLTQTIMGVRDSICITDLNDQIIFANSAFCKMYGCQNGSQVIGKKCSEISREMGIRSAESINGNSQSLNDEYSYIRNDDTMFVVSSSETVIRDEKNMEIAIARVSRDITAKKKAEREREKLLIELQEALRKVKMLSGLLPICSSCKKIRDERGDWKILEEYIIKHSEADFSHGLCSECAEKLYPGYNSSQCAH